ncbi:MAG: hypothetical protein WC148_03930 [Bacilli bacterium]
MKIYKIEGKKYLRHPASASWGCTGCAFKHTEGCCMIDLPSHVTCRDGSNHYIFKEAHSTWADDVEMRRTQDGLCIVAVQNCSDEPTICILHKYISATEAVVEMEGGKAMVVKIDCLKYLREDD